MKEGLQVVQRGRLAVPPARLYQANVESSKNVYTKEFYISNIRQKRVVVLIPIMVTTNTRKKSMHFILYWLKVAYN